MSRGILHALEYMCHLVTLPNLWGQENVPPPSLFFPIVSFLIASCRYLHLPKPSSHHLLLPLLSPLSLSPDPSTDFITLLISIGVKNTVAATPSGARRLARVECTAGEMQLPAPAPPKPAQEFSKAGTSLGVGRRDCLPQWPCHPSVPPAAAEEGRL